jgi:hypothetical protein
LDAGDPVGPGSAIHHPEILGSLEDAEHRPVIPDEQQRGAVSLPI